MKNIINNKYSDAVKGITEELLKDSSAWYNYVTGLPKDEQVVYTVTLFHNQVENGGFHQYFFNSFGQFAFLTIDNLKLISASNTAKLLEEAVAKVNSDNLTQELFRDAVFNRKITPLSSFDEILSNHLHLLDKQYYDMKDEDIFLLLDKYLNKE